MARIAGDDGLIADDVGPWAEQKHHYLTRYISISRAARKSSFLRVFNALAFLFQVAPRSSTYFVELAVH